MTNKELVLTAVVDVFNKRDLTAFDKYFTTNYIQNNPHIGDGIDAVKKFVTSLPKDFRYDLIAPMISAGRIKHFRDVFNYIPKTVVAHDLGINNVRFNKLMDNVEGFLLRDLFRLAGFMEVEPSVLMGLILEQAAADKKSKVRKPKGAR